MAVRDLRDQIAAALAAAEHPEGGWGYQAAPPSRLEPTLWALLATRRETSPATIPSDAHSRYLAGCQQHDGLLSEVSGQPPNLGFNGMAALVFLDRPHLATPVVTRRLLERLLDVRGAALQQTPEIRQDNSLRGWPWTDGAFSWVDPTSWCVLAFKKWRALPANAGTAREWVSKKVVDERLEEAERMLIDRCCVSGGWNYGNSSVMGQDLRPYLTTTAVALLALQDRRDHPTVVKSIDYLTEHALSEPTGMALSLTAICLRVFGRDTTAVDARLATEWERGRYLDLTHVTAMALCALSWPQHHGQPFTL